MLIRNINPLGEVDVPLLDRTVAAGEAVEVSDEDAAQLLPQTPNWAVVDAPADTESEDLL